MKIYFAGSIRGGRDDKQLYFELIAQLSRYGTVLTEHIGSDALSTFGEHTLSDEEIYQRDMAWLAEADVIVAEVTTPSLGVGYEIGKAEEMGKKILCLYRPAADRRLSAMVRGNTERLIEDYQDIKDLEAAIGRFFKNLNN